MSLLFAPGRFGSDDSDGEFIEKEQRDKDEHQGERVSGRRDDGGKDEKDHDCMPAVFLQEFAVEDAEFGQQPGEQRHFED